MSVGDIGRSSVGRARVARFYTSKTDAPSIVTRWCAGSDVGPRIVPSVYVPGYREFVVKIIGGAVRWQREASIVSLGSGVGLVEKCLVDDGFNQVLASDVLWEFVEHEVSLGLKAVRLDAFELEALNVQFDCIYMDGTLGHLASVVSAPWEGCFAKILGALRSCLASDGSIVTSDDAPYAGEDVEVHKDVPHIRVPIGFLRSEVEAVGLRVESVALFPYQRPGTGEVQRRVVVIQRATRRQ